MKKKWGQHAQVCTEILYEPPIGKTGREMHHARPTITCDLRVKYLLAELTPSFIMPVSFLSPVRV